jgi:predicted ATPase
MFASFAGTFVGRREELDRVRSALATPGLVWLSGMGGVGKTRLAAEVAAERGARWVAAGGLDAVALGPAVLRAVGFPEGADPAPDVVARWCRSRRVPLLVLDDVAEHAREWAEALAAAVPVLATSRVAVDLSGHLALRSFTDAADGVTLFFARVPERVGRPPDPARDAPAVEALVSSLGGLPLAIELAAARLQVLDLPALADSLGRSLGWLRDPLGAGRSASVEATVRWSWDLLGPEEAAWLARASVFAGPFRWEDLAAVGGAEGDVRVADALHALVRLHLLEPAGGTPARLRLHPLIHRFAAERRAERPDEGLLARHADRYGASAAALAHRVRRAGRAEALAEAAAERAEHEALLARAERGEIPALPALRAARLFAHTSPARLAAALVDRALALPPGAPAAEGTDRGWLHQHRARRWLNEGRLAAARADIAAGAAHGARVAPLGFALDAIERPADPAVPAALDAAIAACADPVNEPELRAIRAIFVHGAAGDLRAALLDKRACVASVTDDLLGRAGQLESLATTELALGELAAARAHLEEAAPLADPGTPLEVQVRGRLALVTYVEGRRAEAAAALPAVITGFEDVGRAADAAHYRAVLALLRLAGGEPAGDALSALALDALPRRWGPSREMALLAAALEAVRAGQAPPAAPELGARWRAVVDDLAAAAAQLRRGDPAPAATALDRVDASLAGEPAVFDRAMVDAARSTADALRRRCRGWRIAADGSRFAAPDGDWVSLAHRPTLARFVAALLDGHPHPPAALAAAVWPGERVVDAALRNRIQVAASTLRKLGLEVVVRRDGGYGLDPEVVVAVVPTSG